MEKPIQDWLKEICPWGNIENYVEFRQELPQEWDLPQGKYCINDKPKEPDAIIINLYTKDYSYYIKAKEKYLGCIYSHRKPRAGEDWTRGRDLPDGRFNGETWESIKHAILQNEFVKVAKRQELLPDVEAT